MLYICGEVEKQKEMEVSVLIAVILNGFGVGWLIVEVLKLSRQMGELTGVVNGHTRDIAEIKEELKTKASAADVAEIKEELKTKASAADVAEIKEELKTKASAADVAEIKEELKTKASAADVAEIKDELKTKASAKELTEFKVEIKDELKSKASAKEFDELKFDVKDLKQDVRHVELMLSEVVTFLQTKFPAGKLSLSERHSPARLNEYGKKVFQDMNGSQFLEEHSEHLLAEIESYSPVSPYDVEALAYELIVDMMYLDCFKTIRDKVYYYPALETPDRHGGWNISELTLQDVCYVFSIPLRDMYLEEHPWLVPRELEKQGVGLPKLEGKQP